jgi:hypothetical protein
LRAPKIQSARNLILGEQNEQDKAIRQAVLVAPASFRRFSANPEKRRQDAGATKVRFLRFPAETDLLRGAEA